ncbi:MAG TPA: hypothetical protein VFB34_09430 [Chloroflexota bacterium]|nr:hypothetical protein [Chloroflexota bacterium]
MQDPLTEAEFRAFSERLYGFARELTAKERFFLTAILARASTRSDRDVDTWWTDPEWSLSAELAFSIWQSMHSPRQSIGTNPQALPPSELGADRIAGDGIAGWPAATGLELRDEAAHDSATLTHESQNT